MAYSLGSWWALPPRAPSTRRCQSTRQHRERPLAVKRRIGCFHAVIGDLQARTGLGLIIFDHRMNPATAALRRVIVISLICGKSLQRGQQVAAKPPAQRVRTVNRISSEQFGKEIMR